MKRKSMIFLSTLITTMMLLTACGPQVDQTPAPAPEDQNQTDENTSNSKNPKNEKTDQEMDEQTMKAHIAEQQKTIDALKDELEYYHRYVKDITLTLTPEKLQKLIDKEWKYTMTINNIQFPKNGILEISNTDFEIVVSEERAKYSVLTEEDSLKGRIQGDMAHLVTISHENNVINPKEDKGDIHSTLTYSLKGLGVDSVIKIQLQDEMRAKLGMNTDELEIRVVQ